MQHDLSRAGCDIAFTLKHARRIWSCAAEGFTKTSTRTWSIRAGGGGTVRDRVIARLTGLAIVRAPGSRRRGHHTRRMEGAYRDWSAAGWNGISGQRIGAARVCPMPSTPPASRCELGRDGLWHRRGPDHGGDRHAGGPPPLIISEGLPAQARDGNDRYHAAHRAAGRLRCRALRTKASVPVMHLPPDGAEDLHHLWRARSHGDIIHFVLARLPNAPAGTRGISLFLVPKFLLNATVRSAPATTCGRIRSSTRWAIMPRRPAPWCSVIKRSGRLSDRRREPRHACMFR